MGLTRRTQKERKKLRVPILFLPAGRNQYLYPQPLMHVRLSIFLLKALSESKKATDKAESSWGLHLAGGLSCNVSGVTIRVSKVYDLDMDLRSLFHLNHSVVTPLCY